MTNDIMSSITLAFWGCFEDNVQRDEQWTAPWLKLVSGYVHCKKRPQYTNDIAIP